MNRKVIFFLGICNVLSMQLFGMEEEKQANSIFGKISFDQVNQQVAEQEKNINEVITSITNINTKSINDPTIMDSVKTITLYYEAPDETIQEEAKSAVVKLNDKVQQKLLSLNEAEDYRNKKISTHNKFIDFSGALAGIASLTSIATLAFRKFLPHVSIRPIVSTVGLAAAVLALTASLGSFAYAWHLHNHISQEKTNELESMQALKNEIKKCLDTMNSKLEIKE